VSIIEAISGANVLWVARILEATKALDDAKRAVENATKELESLFREKQ
jgi:hypothetical protein